MSTQRRAYKNHLKRYNNSNSTSHNSSSSTNELTSLSEMFPDWELDDLSTLLEEHGYMLEVVIDLIVNNKVSRWEPIKKENKKKKEKDVEEQAPVTASSTLNSNTSNNTFSDGSKPNRHPKDTGGSKTKQPSNRPSHSHKKVNIKSANRGSSQSSTGDLVSKSATSNRSQSGNSWAAALANNKSKPRPKTQPLEQDASLLKDDDQREQKITKTEIVIGEEVVIPLSADEKSAELKPELKDSSVPQEKQGSWASAITPKPSMQASKKEIQTKALEITTIETENGPASQQSDVDATQAQVLLPNASRNLEDVGVSFGSLSLKEEDDELSNVKTSALEQPTKESMQDLQQASQAYSQEQLPQQQQQQQPQSVQQQQQLSQQSQLQELQDSQDQQQRQRYGLYNNQNHYNQQAYQQPQQYAQSKQPQQFDFYNQYQQSQYPEQGGQAFNASQFGAYPGMDYSAYNQQALAAAGINSPAASPAFAANHVQYAQGASQPPSNGASDANAAGQSPMAAQANPNPLQQQVPTTPFGYPYYYNYYNTPFYGNGSNLGGSQSGFSNVNGQPITNVPETNTSQGSSYSGGFVGTNSSQYYNQPNQFANRYPGYANYPQPHGQQGQPGPSQAPSTSAPQAETTDAGNAGGPIAAGTQPAQAPHQSHQPVMPQYGAFQQYPQYGSYQDNSQYRGWY